MATASSSQPKIIVLPQLELLAPVSSQASSPPAALTHTGGADGTQAQLKLEAHRRWNTSLPVGFLTSIDRVEINETRTLEDDTQVYVLEVFLSLPTSRLPTYNLKSEKAISTAQATLPTFTVEHRFSDFEELRSNVSASVSMERQCSCMYCLGFVEYIRFAGSQPRGLVKLFSGVEKRRQKLTTFMNDFVTMGRRRAPQKGRRKCEAQELVPKLLLEFLLQGATY
ncbi:hypothetical protein PHYBOEH_012084 [Phytophthora boehmeriae]|uniref:PX domain-containing protein n=1 Tax=Phytophthora boehmeriae TaxID=109152 RepID=A0A8T1WUK0_9STRA|nr:hypothetical protein PHYBOEH_012084 [Phytophthora boehmeriae]